MCSMGPLMCWHAGSTGSASGAARVNRGQWPNTSTRTELECFMQTPMCRHTGTTGCTAHRFWSYARFFHVVSALGWGSRRVYLLGGRQLVGGQTHNHTGRKTTTQNGQWEAVASQMHRDASKLFDWPSTCLLLLLARSTCRRLRSCSV